MAEQVTIKVYEVVGSELCVASDDGQRVYDQVAAVLREGKRATLSFANVGSLTSAFLNAAVGQLYCEFHEDEIRASLSVSDMESDDLALLKRVVDTAKEYFRNPERCKRARNEALGEGNG